LGYEKHSKEGDNRGNSRNGDYTKTLKTNLGEITVNVPRDRNGEFDPKVVPKHESRLEKSRKFLAFYSIRFPVGLPDEKAYKIFNTWFTRCRRDSGLKTYLWVAERQKNGTIHFHLLTNDFLPIKAVNGYMATVSCQIKRKGLKFFRKLTLRNTMGLMSKR
jgi:hypothetical protein